MKQDLRVVGNHALHNDGGGRRVVEFPYSGKTLTAAFLFWASKKFRKGVLWGLLILRFACGLSINKHTATCLHLL